MLRNNTNYFSGTSGLSLLLVATSQAKDGLAPAKSLKPATTHIRYVSNTTDSSSDIV